MRETYRILDANFNRAREALRVVEDCGRFALNDPAITAMAKNLRSDLKEILSTLPTGEMLTSRDTPGDIGTEITSPSEPKRVDLADVAAAACKRLSEALRTIEEYSKFVAPQIPLKVERMRYNGYTLEQRLIGKLLTAQRFNEVKLYVLISSETCKGSLRECARASIAGGTDAIQLREKSITDEVFLAMAAELRELTDETGKILIINDRPDIAAIVGADGVHLGQGDIPIAEARSLLRPGAIVGKTCRNPGQAKAAANAGADYISVGPIFETKTKDAGPARGIDVFKSVMDAVSQPAVPIGGINADNVGELIEVGAKSVAACSAICSADNPKAAAEAIRAKLA